MWRRDKQYYMRRDIDEKLLSDLEDGQTAIIVAVMGGQMMAKRLADLGITTGTEIKVIRRTLFRGPVQIEVSGSRIVIGRMMARKIGVEVT